MPFQAIADDSGCKGSSPVVVIAGLIGQAEHWADFTDKWIAGLHEAPYIEYFKMYDAVHFSGPFKGLTETARDAKLVELVRVMNLYPFAALYSSVDIAAYEKYYALPLPKRTPEGKRYKARFKGENVGTSPYFYAYNTFISRACFHIWDEGARESFDFIIDEHRSLGPRVKLWYPTVRTLMMTPMRTIMPVDPITRTDHEFMPLQAADMMAWFARLLTTGETDGLEWLSEHFINVKPSRYSLHMDAEAFAVLHEGTEELKK